MKCELLELADHISNQICVHLIMLTPLRDVDAPIREVHQLLVFIATQYQDPESNRMAPVLPFFWKNGPMVVNDFSCQVTCELRADALTDGTDLSLEPDDGESRFSINVRLAQRLYFSFQILFSTTQPEGV